MLSSDHLTRIVATSPRKPLLPFIEGSTGPLECTVCLEYVPGAMLCHATCQQPICAIHALLLIDQDTHCATCRGPIGKNGDFATGFRKLSICELYLADSARWRCPDCNATCTYSEALTHPNSCEKKPARFQPPAPLPPRGTGPLARLEIISNAEVRGPNNRADKLLILHLDGAQIGMRMTRGYHSAMDVKQRINKLTNIDVSKIKLFKFCHREIPNHARVRDFATHDGAHYLSAFTDQPNLPTRTANLIFEEVGAPHFDKEADQILTQQEPLQQQDPLPQQNEPRPHLPAGYWD